MPSAVTSSDAIYVINRLGQTVTSENALADFDGNEQITPSDVIAVINRLGYGIKELCNRIWYCLLMQAFPQNCLVKAYE